MQLKQQEELIMAENKQYITQSMENGSVLISEDVIATIVTHAVDEVEGVAGLNNATIKNWGKGMRISISADNQLFIECNVIVIYGQSVFDAAKAVQAAISNAVLSMTGVEVCTVNVNVTGIVRK